MDLTYEMYAMDFEVFGYDTAIKERPDLVPPKKPRGVMLRATAFDQFSRNSLIDPQGMRVSQLDLFGSVRSSMRKDIQLRCSTSSRRRSLLELDKDEILASVAGIRKFSTVREYSVSSDYSMDDSGHSDSKKDD